MAEIHGERVAVRPGLEHTNPPGFLITAWPLRSRLSVMLLTDEALTKHLQTRCFVGRWIGTIKPPCLPLMGLVWLSAACPCDIRLPDIHDAFVML
jgi:hypothetical protein